MTDYTPDRPLVPAEKVPTLHVTNASTLVSDADIKRMTQVINHSLRYEYAPLLGQLPMPVKYLSRAQVQSLTQSWLIAVVDTDSEPGALGWHTNDTNIYGVVAAKPSLDAGSTALTGPYAVSATLDHEVKETFADPFTQLWWDTGQGYEVAGEVCDPVEADTYMESGVALSNAVLPAWSNPFAKGVPLDLMGLCKHPFEMRRGGYWVQRTGGRATQKFNDAMPQWRRDTKQREFGRGARRVAVDLIPR